MRFRQKFPWLQIAGAALWMGLSCIWTYKPHAIPGLRNAYFVAGFAWAFVLLLNLAGYFFVWWDVTENGLAERRLWRTRSIPWDEVYRVGPWRPMNKRIGDTLEVEYARTGPLSDRGSLTLLPQERQGFLHALRTHAPQAIFDL